MSDMTLLHPGTPVPRQLPAPPLRRALPAGGGRTVLGAAERGPPVPRPRPRLARLGIGIDGAVPLPGEYRPGTPGFRYWAMAEALERVAAPWHEAAGPLAWPGDGRLRVVLAGGSAPEAVYERGRLVIGGGAPVPVAMRALGHAVLDALRPELWHVAAADVAAVHAGVAEVAALLAAPGAGRMGPPGGLPRQPLGRAFDDAVQVLAAAAPRLGEARLVALRAARLLATALRGAAVTPDFTAQVAGEMALAAEVSDGPLVASALREAFAHHGLLARCPALEGYDPHAADDGTPVMAPLPPLPWVAMAPDAPCHHLPLLVCAAAQPPLLAQDVAAPAPAAAARHYVQSLAAGGMLESPRIGRHQRRAPGTHPLATHRLLDDGRVLRLVRQRFVAA